MGMPVGHGRLSYPFTRETAVDPSATYEALRETCPVAPVIGPFGQPMWLLTRFEDVCTALSDSRFSRAAIFAAPSGTTVAAARRDDAGVLLNTDPPHHDRLRGLASRFMSARRMESLRPQIGELAAQLASTLLESAEPAEFNALFADPMSRGTMGDLLVMLLDVPPDDQDWFRAVCDTLLRVPGTAASPDGRVGAVHAIQAYLARLIETRRPAPGHDMIGAALGRRRSGQQATDAEITAVILNILFGGHAAVVSALGYCVVTLLGERGRWRMLARDPSSIEDAVEEVLRYRPAGDRGLLRIALTDVELSSRVIPAGDLVIPCIAAANRDPGRFARPGEFLPGRPDGGHISFGHGTHACLGMALARLELRISLLTLAQRIPHLALARPVSWLTRTHDALPVSPLLQIPVRTHGEVTAHSRAAGVGRHAPVHYLDTRKVPEMDTLNGITENASAPIVGGLAAPSLARPVLLYVNIPFCNSKCHFCDWVTEIPVRDLRMTSQASGRLRYLHALQTQVRSQAPALVAAGYHPEIMYWGGGTASILEPGEIETIYGAIAAEIDLDGIAEATIEGSPDSMDIAKLRLLRQLGFNRISIGVQSFEDHRLHKIGRAHSAAQAVKSIEAARAAGFDNVNLDLIVGFPDESLDEVARTARRAAALPVNHFSVYPYRASPGTVMRKQLNRTDRRSDLGHQLDAYRLTSDVLEHHGFAEYAMSYFGGPRCQSDEAYYRLLMDWAGFGSGANSLLGHRFLANKRGQLHRYNARPTEFDVDVPASSPPATLYFLSQALTTIEGMDARLFQERTGVSLRSACGCPEVMSYLESMSEHGRLIIDRNGIRLHREDIAQTYIALNWIDGKRSA
jgi:cytochrome P450/coproporphyrinogen III oxidase-like Fe-S oxidoreductase